MSLSALHTGSARFDGLELQARAHALTDAAVRERVERLPDGMRRVAGYHLG